MRILYFIPTLFIISLCKAELPSPNPAPEILWTRTFGEASGDESAYSIARTADNSFLIGGTVRPFSGDSSAMTLMMVNDYGEREWQKFFWGTGQAEGRAANTTNEGGYIIAGYTDFGDEPSRDHYLVNTDSTGTQDWDKISDNRGADWVMDILQARGGGFISTGRTPATGNTQGTFHILKTNKPGKVVWTRNVEGEQGNAVIEIADGNLVAAGYTRTIPETARPPQIPDSARLPWEQKKSHEDTALCREEAAFYVVSVNFTGEINWSRAYWKSGFDMAYDLCASGDGGLGIAGAAGGCADLPNKYDAYVIRTTATGDTVWTYTFAGDDEDQARSIVRTSDGGFVVAGYTYSYGSGQADVLVFKLNSDGKLLWSTTIGGKSFDHAFAVVETADGGIVVAGETSSNGSGGNDIYLVRLAKN